MPERLAGKRVFITGGASGIGQATAEMVVAEGGWVVIADINEVAASALAARLGPQADFIRCDVTREDDIKDAVEEAERRAGPFNVLINNAGMIAHQMIEDIEAEVWDKVFAVNMRSTFLVSKYAIPHLKAAGGGSIVNMSSMAGLRGAPGLSAYSASKAAINGFTVALALELAPAGIRVNSICPGWVDTTFNQPVIDALGGAAGQERVIKSSIPLERQGTPKEIAALAIYLASDESAFVTAQAISINGGAYN
jgi:dihydroanticapsin dehydrogenase